MKKVILALAVLTVVLLLAACGTPATTTETPVTTTEAPVSTAEAPVLSHAQYAAAALDTKVTIEAYVQATQSWWDNKITVYAQDQDGAYFMYEMACAEADASKLTPGTKIRVTGYKASYKGEIEIIDATFEILEGDTYVATATDLTALLGTDELINHQNELAVFKGMTVDKIEYKNGAPGDDIYLTLSKDGKTYDFCVEIYLTGESTPVYQTVATLKTGDVIDVEGFVYWYDGVNPHVTGITVQNSAN